MAAVYLGFSFLINILFAYTRFFIVFEHDKAFDAMGKSVRMALDNLEVTFRLYFTLLLVYVRTILTVVAFIVFPLVISAILTYVSIDFVKTLAIIATGAMVMFFLVFISHLNSVLEIFVESLWFKAWKDNASRMTEDEKRHDHGHDGHEHDGHSHAH